MAWTAITASQTDANSPVDQTLMDAIRTDLDDLNTRVTSLGLGAAQNIFDEGAATIGTTGIDANLWTATGTVAILAEHTIRLGNAAGAHSIRAAPAKIRIKFSEEYVAVYEARAKRGGGSNADHLWGWQDDAVAAANLAITMQNMAVFRIDNADAAWRFTVASGGVTTEVTGLGNVANWTTLKIVVTCSATAGNRKVQAYLDGSEISGSPFTTNLTASVLVPIQACNNTGDNPDDRSDYIYAYFQNRPVAP
jgi:hypothetical protein